MTYIDTHAHLDDEQFAGDRQEVVDRAGKAGVEAIICPAIGLASSRAAIHLAQSFPGVFAAVGIQPNYVAEAAAEDWPRVAELARHPRAVAVGETGLDRYWDFTPLEQQRRSFAEHLKLAQQLDLPVIIHCRQAETDVLEILDEALRRGPLRGVMHAFSGGPQWAEQCLQRGLYISFAGTVTYRNKKFQPLHEAARVVPADRLLVETDSPYLVPHPLRGKQKRNEPQYLVHTVRRLAELRGVPPELLAAQTTANAAAIFGLPQGPAQQAE